MHTPRGLIVKNKHLAATSSCQVSSENGNSKTPTIATRQKHKARKWLKYSTFGQNKNRLLIKIVLSIDGRLLGGDEGNRTPDLLNANQTLSHLSYAPIDAALITAEIYYT